MQLREVIIRILRASEQPLGAYDIAKHVSRLTGRKCHANSIYRVLGPMICAGQVQSIATTRSYVLVAHGPSTLLWCICQNCEECRPLAADAIHQSLDMAARSNGFRPSQRYVELIGLCPDCSSHGQGLTMK